MKLLLKENIENLGKKGDIVEVAPGYGRNYLIPKKFGIRVTPSNMKMIEIEQKALKKGFEKEMESYNKVIERLNNTQLTFKRKTGEKDTIYGSVSASDIKEALEKQDFDIDRKRILMDEPIKKLGTHTVPVKVFQEYKGEVKVEVKKEGEEEEEKAAEAKKEEETQEKEQKKKEEESQAKKQIKDKPKKDSKKKE